MSTSQIFAPSTPPAGPGGDPSSPPPAPNKLDINGAMELKQFKAKDVQSLMRVDDIQSLYNALHSRGRVCGVCTAPLEGVTNASYIGNAW
jgi:hypothetical protein